MPPTTTGASTARSRRSRTVSGTSSRCEPERIDRPTTSTSSSPAAAAICSGVSRMPWYTTSMPASRAATAICSAPLEWPSSPGLPTRIRIGPPTPVPPPSPPSRTSPTPPPPPPPPRSPPAPGRPPVLAEHVARPAGRPAARPPRLGRRDRRGRQVLVGGGDLAHALQGARPGVVVPLGPPCRQVLDLLRLGGGVELEDVRLPAVVAGDEGRRRRLRVLVHADDRQLARLAPADPLGMARPEPDHRS